MICIYCGIEVLGNKAASHKLHCEKKPKELKDITKSKQIAAKKNCHHSEETKQKLSNIRKEYLSKNPDQVPYKLNHKHKKTYPEVYFGECLPNFVHGYRIPETLYEGDFVNPDLKIIIEIDGEQHYVDKKIVQHDIIRTKMLEELGWKLVRIRWSDFQKLDRADKENIISQLNEYSISNFDISKYIPEPPKCKDCGKILSDKRSKRCAKCSTITIGSHLKKFDIPKEELQELVSKYNLTQIGNMHSVSGNTVKKWCKRYGINYKISRFTP